MKNLLRYSIEVISKKQVELAEKVEQSSKIIDQMHKFMSMLDDKNKHAFLNLILNKKENWDQENLNRVFKPSFRIIY